MKKSEEQDKNILDVVMKFVKAREMLMYLLGIFMRFVKIA